LTFEFRIPNPAASNLKILTVPNPKQIGADKHAVIWLNIEVDVLMAKYGKYKNTNINAPKVDAVRARLNSGVIIKANAIDANENVRKNKNINPLFEYKNNELDVTAVNKAEIIIRMII